MSLATSGVRVTRALLAVVIACAIAPATTRADTIPVKADGISQHGTISYDREGVPLIRAKNENDAAFLTGYAQARDRLFQMDFNRRAAAGTLAEVLGPAAIAQDVQIRTLGIGRAARATLPELSDDTRAWLAAYANGVNAWIRSNPAPKEYGALELTKVAPWTPVDSVMVSKLLAMQLNFSLDLDYTAKLGAYQQAGAAHGFDGAALFFADTHRVQPADDRLSMPNFLDDLGTRTAGGTKRARDGGGAVDAVPQATIDLARAYVAKNADHPIIGRALRALDGRGGSNGWVIAPEHSKTGHALIANDPHLSLPAPSQFIEMRVVAGDTLDVSGLAMPGTPVLQFACNPDVCWGVTTNHLDVTDVYHETFTLNAYGLPTHSVYQGRHEPLQWIFQSYRVNLLDGEPDTVVPAPGIGYANGGLTFVVPRRNHGPVIQIAGDQGLSVQYAGWSPTFELEGLRDINRARNLAQFREAAARVDVGSVNLLYADRAGNIAMMVTGETPLRDDLQNLGHPDGAPPYIVRDGSGAHRHEWLPATTRAPDQALPYQILPWLEMPYVANPAQGYIANANNDDVGTTLDNDPFNEQRPGGGSYYINWYNATYRIGRIDRLIRAAIDRGDRIGVDDLKRWQANNQLLDAELLLPYLLDAAENGDRSPWAPLREIARDPRVVEAVARLRDWDYSTPTGIREGYDAGDDPANLPAPRPEEIANSVAATLYAGWRSEAVRTVIDATLARVGITTGTVGNAPSPQQGGREALSALQFHLAGFPQRHGIGVSGVDFFRVDDAPTREDARDYVLVRALRDAIVRYTGPEFAAAFGDGATLSDLRWGRLHRVTFRHVLRGPFDVPDAAATHGFANLTPQLAGLARDGGYEVPNDGEHDIRGKTVDGFTFANGVVMRFVGEMAPQPKTEMLLNLGQSGDTGSAHYADQLARWLTVRYKPMRSASEANAERRYEFTPNAR